MAFSVIFVEFLIILFFVMTHLRDRSRSSQFGTLTIPFIAPNRTNVFQLPLAVIDIHTSAASFDRVTTLRKNFFASDPFIANGTFHFRVVVSKFAQVPSWVWPISRVDCSDTHETLPCRVDQSYPNFLQDFPECGWHFRADDDTWLNTTRMYHYILMLLDTYDPRVHIVFRAHANPERLRNWYVHGGSGWLSSRAFIYAHVRLELSLTKLLPWARYHQQDTAQSIIVRHMYPHPVLWDEMGMEGFACTNCGTRPVVQGIWDELPECPPRQQGVRLTDLWAIHTASLQGDTMAMLNAAKAAPATVLLVRNNIDQRIFVCRAHPDSLIWNPRTRPLAFLVLGDLPKPLYDYALLPDDNRI
jgi:hypothetical protein